MLKIPGWILAIIVFNIAVFLILLHPNSNFSFPSSSNNNENMSNASVISNQPVQNQSSNQTLNDSYYTSKCINSLGSYVKNVVNITTFTAIETKFFNQTNDAINYVKNWSSSSYELIGIGKDIYSLNKSVVSVNYFKTNYGNFTLPIVCDENGTIGNYSSCMLSNITNITYYCHNTTQNLSECDIEEAEHGFWDDINYWITPSPGPLNETQLFNFTITSSRNRLEYATLNIYYRRPPDIDQILFNQSQSTANGDRIEITTTLDLTGKIYGGLIVETYFKKKCYRYGLLDQYLY